MSLFRKSETGWGGTSGGGSKAMVIIAAAIFGIPTLGVIGSIGYVIFGG